MQQDAHGLAITASSSAAAAAFDHAITGYTFSRADVAARVQAALSADPEFGLAHCMQGYLAMSAFNVASMPTAERALGAARRLTRRGTDRERAHVAALAAWFAGHPDQASLIWNSILREHPRDVLAFRVAHFLDFWLGRPDLMLDAACAVERHWSPDLPGWGMILACKCFALEECGRYAEAEAAGRAAIDLNPANLWAAHGVAHVFEMQGRRAEGLAWIDALRGHWEGASNMRHHLWWHAAMFRLEYGETDAALILYDGEFRNPSSPLTAAQPDLYIDVQNAASMLFLLQRHGVDVGDRWTELADKAESRIGDCLSAFTLPHWMMALAATGRGDAAVRLLDSLRDFAAGAGVTADIVGRYAIPVCEAVRAYFDRDHTRAVALMRPVLGGMHKLGGSHAQQDVLEQLYMNAAAQAGLHDDVRLSLERAASRRALPLRRRVGYAAAAEVAGFA